MPLLLLISAVLVPSVYLDLEDPVDVANLWGQIRYKSTAYSWNGRLAIANGINLYREGFGYWSQMSE